MTPIERAARAIADYLERRKETDIDSFFGDVFAFDDLRAARIDATVDLVAVSRAVLQAIREPSEGMRTAIEGAEPDDTWPGAWDYSEKLAIAQWQAMIDAALEEG